jgi:hypothetical protein
VGEINKGEKKMKVRTKMTILKQALALAAVLAMSGTGWAKKPSFAGPGLSGSLEDANTLVKVFVPVRGFEACNPTPVLGTTLSIKVFIFQPSGRIFAIGIGSSGDGSSSDFTCSTDPNVTVDVAVSVYALPGLSFKPGPATLVYQVIQTDTTATPPTTAVLDEYGSRIDLH